MAESDKLLNAFVHFCKVNPHLRFWQALSAWSGNRLITADGQDTFYWNGQFGFDPGADRG